MARKSFKKPVLSDEITIGFYLKEGARDNDALLNALDALMESLKSWVREQMETIAVEEERVSDRVDVVFRL